MSVLKIGWGKREISTNDPVSIPGQMHIRVSEGIADPLYVTALCVDGGEGQDQAIFLSCDLGALGNDIINQVCSRVAAMCPEIPTDAIILNATHTHAGVSLGKTPEKTPDGVAIYPGEETGKFVFQMAAEAVCEAWNNRSEGGIAYGYGYAVVAHSRRVVYFKEEKLATNQRDFMTPSGYAVMYGKTNDPLFSHYEAGADHFLNVLYTFDSSQKLTGVVVNVPCPSQIAGHSTKLSADYWHDVRCRIAEEFGEDVFVLPQCAAAGDLSPRILHYLDAQRRRMYLKYGIDYSKPETMEERRHLKGVTERLDIAERIVEGVKEVYAWAKKDIRTDVPVRHRRVVMSLERRRVTEEEKQWCEENLELLKDMAPKAEEMTPEEYRFQMSRHNTRINRNKRGLTRYEDALKEPTIDVPAHMVQLGDVAFATTRFELFMDFMHRLQARSPFIQTFVVQLAGAEHATYLPTERAKDANGYSASMFCNQFSPYAGQQWVEGTLEVLNKMKAEDEV